jgi:hypothetical protein
MDSSSSNHDVHGFQSREGSNIEMTPSGKPKHSQSQQPKRMTNDGNNLLTLGAETTTPKGGPSDNTEGEKGHRGSGDSTQIKSDFQIKLERARKTAEWFGEHGYFSTLMSVITIYTLYQSDIRLAATSGTDADFGFMIVASAIFFLFLFEIFLQSFYKEGYCYIPTWAAEPNETFTETWWRRMQIGSFYFWLDWIATLTLIFDVSFNSLSLSLSLSFFLS